MKWFYPPTTKFVGFSSWLFFLVSLCSWFPAHADTVVFTENFEAGQGNWNADNGVWDVGTPSVVGPTACSQGSKCAATVLNANYPQNTNSRLVSPSIILPAVTGAERLMLLFQDWHDYSYYDYGKVQISSFDATSSTWSEWQDNGNAVSGTSAGWSKDAYDLTTYAGKKIRIGFYHFSDDNGWLAAGWYIDDVQIVSKQLQFDGSFETGLGDWYADNGVWAIGTPTSGPMGCHTGIHCAGTVLGGNYPQNTNSRLVALAPVQLPTVSGLDEIHLRFWESHYYSYYDYGKIQISSFDSTSSTWSAWQDVGTVSGTSTAWLRKDIDLTAYSGKKVRLGFYHFSDDNGWLAAGWYIDDIEIPGASNPTSFALTVSKTGTGTGTVTSAPAGINCGATCSANFASGTSVVLTAAATAGSNFANWSGACTGTASTCTVAMTAAKTVTTTFNLATISVPAVTTNAATGVTAIGATLNGTVTPKGAATTVTFDFGTTTAYGASITATPATIAGTATATAVRASKTGLVCNTTYNYRVKAVNSAGTTYGTNASFKTAACLGPIVVTNAATGVTASGATLNGLVTPNGAATTVTFDFGTTTAYGQSVAAVPGSIAVGAAATAVRASKTGLVCNTTYNYRVKAVNSLGTKYGANLTFKTTACLGPIVTSGAATGITATAATLNGVVTPNGAATTVTFDFGTTTSYGTSVVATPNSIAVGAAATAVRASKTALVCNTTYNYRVKAVNSRGTSYGANVSFKTTACLVSKPDLVITVATLTPATPVAGNTFSVTLTVKNQGTLASNSNFLDVWANQATAQTCGAAGDGWAYVDALAAGASKTITVTDLTADVAGAKTLRVFVDSACEIVESNEVNNQFTKTYTVQ